MSEVEDCKDATTGIVNGVTIKSITGWRVTSLTNYKFSGELAALIESAGYVDES